MKVKVRNFRSIERADMDLDGVTLLGGRNEAGKSSLCAALHAALTNSPLPYNWLTKKDAIRVVKDYVGEGSVTIEDGDNKVSISWPLAEVLSHGVLQSSNIATGAIKLMALKPAERATALAPYFKAEPTMDDFLRAAVDGGLDEEQAKKVWEATVAKFGWDEASTKTADKVRDLRADWKAAARTEYGSVKAAGWKPEGWSDDLDDATEKSLEAELRASRLAYEDKVKLHGVSANERDRLKAVAAGAEAAEKRLVESAKQLEAAIAHREALPPAVGSPTDTCNCPACGVILSVRGSPGKGWVLKEAEIEAISAEELKDRRLQLAGADGTVDRLTNERRQALSAAEQARDAVAKVAALPPGDDTPFDREAAMAPVTRAENQLAMFQTWAKAAAIQAQIVRAKIYADILAPDGVRKTVLMRKLEEFNEQYLAPLWGAAKWKPLALDSGLNLTVGGRPYQESSESAQWRALACLQLACAKIDNSALVILDRGDVLDEPNRDGVFRMFKAAGVPVLITMTYSGAERMPDLARAKLGRTYWIDAGIVKPLDQAIAKSEAA